MRKGRNLQSEFLVSELLLLAQRLDIEVRREILGDNETPTASGIAVVRGTLVLFLDRRLSAREAVEVLVEELSRFSLDGLFLKPAVRRLFESWEDR